MPNMDLNAQTGSFYVPFSSILENGMYKLAEANLCALDPLKQTSKYHAPTLSDMCIDSAILATLITLAFGFL